MFDTDMILFDNLFADIEINEFYNHRVSDHLFHDIVSTKYSIEERTFLFLG